MCFNYPTKEAFIFLPSRSFYRSSVRKTFSQHYSFFFLLSNPFLPTQISSRKMLIELPKGLPFSVDTWTSSSKRKRHHPQRPLLWHLFPILFPYLLNPSHQDSGPSTLPPGFSLLTGFFFNWVELDFEGFVQLHDSLFVEIEIGQSMVVDDPDGAFTVTAFDTSHCPGLSH
ncbi:hypothetical protein ACB092_04G202100 [Castanea dentata]